MNETELERLVIRLMGDSTSYLKMLKDAQQHSEQTAHVVERSAGRIEHFTHSIESFGAAAAKSLAALGVAFEAKEALEKFEHFEKAQIQMEAILKSNERDIKAVTAEYKKFSTEIANTTTASKGEVMQLLRTAETYGITGKAAEKAAKDALAVAKITEGSPEALLRMSQAIAKDDEQTIMRFKRMVPQLRELQDKEEIVAKWNKLVTAGFEVMGKELDTVGGRTEKAKQQLGVLSKDMGGMLAEVLSPMAARLTSLVQDFNDLDPATRRNVASVLSLTAAVVALNAILPATKANLVALLSNPYILATTIAISGGMILNDQLKSTAERRRLAEEQAKKLNAVNTQIDPSKFGVETAKAELVRLQGMRDAEAKRLKDTAWWNETLGEHAGKTLEPIDRKMKELKDSIAEAGKAMAESAQHGKAFNNTFLILGTTFIQAKKQAEEWDSENKSFNQSLVEQIKSLQLGADAAKLYWMKMHGFSEERIKETEALQQQKKALEEANKLFTEATSIREQFKDPNEKFAEQQKRLVAMLFSLQISWQEYGKALEDVRRKLFGVAAASRDAAAAGSAEAMARLADAADMLKGPNTPNLPPLQRKKERGPMPGEARAVIPEDTARGFAILAQMGMAGNVSGGQGAVEVLTSILALLQQSMNNGIQFVRNTPGN